VFLLLLKQTYKMMQKIAFSVQSERFVAVLLTLFDSYRQFFLLE